MNKLPRRYWRDAERMRRSLISRLLLTTNPHLRRARLGACYGASWQRIGWMYRNDHGQA